MGWVFYCGPICEEFAAEVPALEMAILRRIFFSHIFFEFLVFVAIIGKISSSSSQSRRKNSKIHWCGLFLAGRKCPGYLARARARARARPSCSTGASGPFDDRRLRSTTFRARATLVLLLYRTFFGALIVLLRLEANLSGSTLTCRFTFICRFWVLLKVYRLIPSRTTVVRDFACFRVFSFFFADFCGVFAQVRT